MSQRIESAMEEAYTAYMQGNVVRAESVCADVLRKAPRNDYALRLMAHIRLHAGDARAAVALLQKALKAKPADEALLAALGNAQLVLGDYAASEQTLTRALKLTDVRRAAASRGSDEALAAIRCAVSLGIAQERLGRTAEAVASYRRALEVDPDSVHALSNLGKALRVEGRLDEAKGACLHALQVEPGFTDARMNLAAVYAAQGDAEAALGEYERVLAAEPEAADAQYSYAALALALADFERGWRAYRWRPTRVRAQAAGVKADTALPARLEGARIAVLGEQGLGDELFFLRYARELARSGARVHAQCDPRLVAMVERSGAFESVFVPAAPVPAAECVVIAGDLPLMMHGAETQSMPPPLALTPLADRVERVRARLAALGPPPYIALTWRAGTPPDLQLDRTDRALYKSVPFDALAAALHGVPGTVVAIQREPRADEIPRLAALLARDVHDLSTANADLEDMLALLALVDEYIGASNTNMHLRAGVQRTARVLVPNPPEWRWMWSGERSPWFPGFEVYRESHGGGWDAAASRLAQDLAPDRVRE